MRSLRRPKLMAWRRPKLMGLLRIKIGEKYLQIFNTEINGIIEKTNRRAISPTFKIEINGIIEKINR